MRILLLTLLLPLALMGQPTRLPEPPLRPLNVEQFRLPPPPNQPGLFTLWPTSRLKFTGSLGFNTINWSTATSRGLLGYDIRLKFYATPEWNFLIRHQTMYITSDESLQLGVIYHIPLHRKKSPGIKL